MTVPKGKPADPVDRMVELSAAVARMGKVLAEINADEELTKLVLETRHYSRYNAYNLGIELGYLVHQARTLFDAVEGLGQDEYNVVFHGRHHDDPLRVRPLREVWPLCPHDRALRMPTPACAATNPDNGAPCVRTAPHATGATAVETEHRSASAYSDLGYSYWHDGWAQSRHGNANRNEHWRNR